MKDEALADLLGFLGIVNIHENDVFNTYSLKPHSKMSYIANEIVTMRFVAEYIEIECLQQGFPLRLSYRDNKYICIVEKSWITVENQNLNRAIIEACALTLEGTMK